MVPVAVVGLVMTGIPGLTVSVKTALPVPETLLALTEIIYVPALVGVPEITPVEVLTVKPLGRPVAAKPIGKLLAVMV